MTESKKSRCVCLGALAATAMLSLTGCTAIGALAGAAVDLAVVSSPLWGPGVVNQAKIESARSETSLGRVEDPEAEAFATSSAGSESLPEVVVRPFEGPEASPDDDDYCFSAWLFLPLVPYIDSDGSCPQLAPPDPLVEFRGRATERRREFRIPLKRFAEPVRPAAGKPVRGEARRVAMEFLRGEVASQPLTDADYAVAYYDSQRSSFLFSLTLFTCRKLARDLRPRNVRVELPRCAGSLRLSEPRARLPETFKHSGEPDWKDEAGEVKRGEAAADAGEPAEAGQPAKPEDAKGDEKAGGAPPQKEECFPAVGLSVEGDDLLAVVPTTRLRVHAQIRDHSDRQEGGKSPIIVQGRVTALRMEASNIAYGLTVFGANLLSFLGLPLSSNRMVLELEIEARRAGEGDPIVSETYVIETPREAASLYYGGDSVDVFSGVIDKRLTEILSEIAQKIRPHLTNAD